jgi:hypothetical protein
MDEVELDFEEDTMEEETDTFEDTATEVLLDEAKLLPWSNTTLTHVSAPIFTSSIAIGGVNTVTGGEVRAWKDNREGWLFMCESRHRKGHR